MGLDGKKSILHREHCIYFGSEEKGVHWRGELRDLLKHWAPEFQKLFNKKRVMTDEYHAEHEAMQVNPLLL